LSNAGNTGGVAVHWTVAPPEEALPPPPAPLLPLEAPPPAPEDPLPTVPLQAAAASKAKPRQEEERGLCIRRLSARRGRRSTSRWRAL